ncbi:MAG: MMPL family transporter [Xanthomonadaceae bacterium]|nr:MMPL family transporter [Rhodospirillaceae bacterium]NIA17987.1 MMPL family transporter [Xanthomonadaceae bacterium]
MNLPKFSVDRPVTITMMVLIIVVFGFVSFSRLGLDMLPDIEFPVVSVVTSYSGATSEDIEDVITKPIEDAVATVKDVKSIKSFSQEGISAVMIEFNSGTNVDFAAQDIRDKIGLIEDYLPQDARQPMVIKMDVRAMPILGYGVMSDSLTTSELKKILKDNIKDKIERLDGVASVELRGGQEREILIKLDKPKLELYNLTQTQIVQILRGENINLSGGFIEQGLQEFSLRTKGKYKNLEEIKNTIIVIKNETPIYLKDVAKVMDTHKELRSYCRTNKKNSILLLVAKQSGANTSQVAKAVKQELPILRKDLPQDIDFKLVMDQSHLIKTSTDSVTQSGVIGGLLAMLIIYLFLRNWRPTLAIGLAIPLSLIATFIPIYAVGYTLNLMTLGGLSLGIGMLVDNSVVVIENIYRHLEKNGKRQKAAIIGAKEVGMAITAATLTTIAVFLPMSFGSGIIGQISRGLSLTIIFSLSASLFVALTLVPMIASKIFKKREKTEDYRKASGEKYFKKIQNVYKKILIWSLNNRFKTMAVVVSLLIGVIALIPSIGTEFMPVSDQGMMLLGVKMPVGSSLEETDKAINQIEDALVNIDGISVITSFVGLDEASRSESIGLGLGSTGINEAQIFIRLRDKKDRKYSAEDIQEIIRKNIPKIRGIEINFTDMSKILISGSSFPVEIKIFGKDLDVLKNTANEIAKKIQNIEGVRDVDTTLSQGKPELIINIDREKASYLGLSVGQIGSVIKNSMQGSVATQLRQGGEETDIRVRFDKIYRDDIKQIENLTITTPFGSQIPLKQVAKISKGEGPVKINREDQLRVVSVTANILDRDVGSVVRDIKNKLSDYELPSGYFIEYGGSYKQMQDTFNTLGWALALGILLVYMVMASQFESLIHPFIVMFELPLAFIGVGLALFITGQTLSLPSFMGIIMLAGIVVNNAIVLIDYINQLREKGMDKFDALVEGGVIRLRPILITSTTTVLGMLPMALARQEGSEMMRPMAIAVIGGLLASTILTLVVIPVVYSLVEKFSKRIYVRVGKVVNGK